MRTTFKNWIKTSGTIAGLAILVANCGSAGHDGGPIPGPSGNASEVSGKVIDNYAQIAYASYQDSLTTAKNLQTKLNDFTNNPDENKFQAAKDAWKTAREPYGQTEIYRFYDGPIDNSDTGPEAFINSWPLDEAHIDYLENKPDSGIINDLKVDLSKEGLRKQNLPAGFDDNVIATGYHAIEFLLWGQDLNKKPEDSGLRPYTDYMDGKTAKNQGRRRTYLKNVGEILTDDLQTVVNAWAPDQATNYRAQFLKVSSDEALRRIFVGVGSLAVGELSSQRMSVALLTNQEDEHSCFSDNTHRDIVNNFQGVWNVYYGSYTRIDGTKIQGSGLSDLFKSINPTLESSMDKELHDAKAAIEVIDQKAKAGDHFDQQIESPEDSDNIRTAVSHLAEFGNLLSQMAAQMKININVDNNGE